MGSWQFFYGIQDPEKAMRNLKIEDGSRKIGDGSLELWRLRIWVMASWQFLFFYGISVVRSRKSHEKFED
jgi:hypothetical protein